LHRSRVFFLDSLNRLVPVVLHHTFLLKVLDLFSEELAGSITSEEFMAIPAYPCSCARRFKLCNLLSALLPSFLVSLHGIYDVVVVQAREKGIAGFPALLPRGSVGSYTAAIGGLIGVRRPREPAHYAAKTDNLIGNGG
jgi:hypothetical protein